MNSWATGLALTAAMAVSGCVTTPVPSSAAPPAVTAADRPATFDYPQGPIAYQNHDLPELDSRYYRVKRISFTSHGDNGQPDNLVTARYYRGVQPRPRPLLIVLPIWGSHTYPSTVISNGVRRRSDGAVDVLMIEGADFLINWYEFAAAPTETDFEAEVDRMGNRLWTAAMDTRRFVDWAQQREDIDPERIGVIGFSMGALVGSLVAASEGRLAATVLVMGAADFPGVMAACDGRPGMAREALTQRFDWSVEEYRARVGARIAHLDPSHFTEHVDPSRIFMIDAYYDDCMPRETRDALWESLGQPRRMSFMAAHKTAFLYMTPLAGNYMRGEIYRFLEAKLQAGRPVYRRRL